MAENKLGKPAAKKADGDAAALGKIAAIVRKAAS